jgi:hypothetical protein
MVKQLVHGLLILARIIPPVHRSAESVCIREAGGPVGVALQEFMGKGPGSRGNTIWLSRLRHARWDTLVV